MDVMTDGLMIGDVESDAAWRGPVALFGQHTIYI
jgi:hypothetical protein